MGGFADYERYDGLGLAELVKRGDVSAEELLDSALDRVEHHRALNFFVHAMIDEARTSIQAGLPAGPFQGVPFLLKDLHLFAQGAETTNGSRLFRGQVGDHDSELVSRYRAAGFVIFGKTTSPEFGLTTTTESTLFGATRNPWNPEHTSGGSSGGASAAVAAGVLPIANASDGGGSIRIPAACTGLFGMKPTRGRTPMGPDSGEGWSGMSCVHAVSRSVRDNAALLDATAGGDVGAPYAAPPPARPFLDEVGADPGRLRIALTTAAWNGAEVHPDCVEAVAAAGRLCGELGHEVVEESLPIDTERLGSATGTIIGAHTRWAILERAKALGREATPEDVEPLTWAMAARAADGSSLDYVTALKSIHAIGREVGGFFQRYDVILTPTMAVPPLPIGTLSLANEELSEMLGALTRTVGFTQLFNATGNPAMSVPLHWNGAGLPIGVQFAGRMADEATLFRLAAQLETARPWFDRRPQG